MAEFFNPLQIALKPLLEKAIDEDYIFAETVVEKMENKTKSFEEMCEYILGEAYDYAKNHKTGNFGLAGMPDEDMVGLIKHYWDEDDIEVKKISGASVKVATTKTKADSEAEDGAEAPKQTSAPKPKKKASKKAVISEDEPMLFGADELFS